MARGPDKKPRAKPGEGKYYLSRKLSGYVPTTNRNALYKSAVDPRLTVDPSSGKTICGAIKRSPGKNAFLISGLTVDDLLADPKLFDRWICKSPPLGNTNHGENPEVAKQRNGRCRLHGGAKNIGRPPVTGKYSKFLTQAPLDEIKRLQAEGHKDLSEELSLMVKMIQDYVPIALGKVDDLIILKGRLRKKLFDLQEAYLALNVQKAKSLIDELIKLAETSRDVEAAQAKLSSLLLDYTRMFEAEVKRRALSGEYIPKKNVLIGYTMIFNLCAQYIPDEHKEHVKRELGAIITQSGGNILSAENSTSAISDIDGFINPYEGSADNEIFAESSPKSLSKREPKIKFV